MLLTVASFSFLFNFAGILDTGIKCLQQRAKIIHHCMLAGHKKNRDLFVLPIEVQLGILVILIQEIYFVSQ